MAKLTEGLRSVVGDKAAKRLATLGPAGLRTLGDLLTYYPRRYETRGELTNLAALRDGEDVTVQAEIVKSSVRPMRNRRGSMLEAVVTDGQGNLSLTFFGKGSLDWRQRATEYTIPDGLATAVCPSAEDIAIAKLCAWREKDQVWLREAFWSGVAKAPHTATLLHGELPDAAPARDELMRRMSVASHVGAPPEDAS